MKSAGIILLIISISLCSLLPHSANARQTEPSRGLIIEKVICKSDATQSYALYLPSTYSPSKTWPIIYCFDPAARGAVPLTRFKDAAEKYGYILIGSNNSRNGPDVPLSNIVNVLFEDSSSRLSIDEKRIYVAGFSGGARVACNIGYVYQKAVHGVIACGAGFPPQQSPSRSVPFVLFGTVGTEDFNYAEMKDLDEALDNFRIPHRVEVFEGGHDWAPAELCRKAIEWMEIQAMKSDRRAKDEALIGELFEKAANDARSLDSSNRMFDAFLAYKALLEFRGLRDTAEFEKRVAELSETKEVKQSVKEDREQIAEQKRRAAEIYALRARLRDKGEAAISDPAGTLSPQSGTGPAIPGVSAPVGDVDPRPLIISDIRRKLNELGKKSDAKEPSTERATARRVLNQYMAYSRETTMILFMSKKYDLAVSHLSVETEIQPDNARLFYNLACAYSMDGNKKKAIDALKKAVQKGFRNVAEITSSEALAPLREEASFQKLVEQIRQESVKTKS